jgi:hypothetical protein
LEAKRVDDSNRMASHLGNVVWRDTAGTADSKAVEEDGLAAIL